MSQLNVDTIKKADGTGNLSVPAETGTVVTTASPSLGRRNLIINGAMQVAQRGTSFTNLANGSYGLDRFSVTKITGAVVDILQTSDAPTASEAGYLLTHCLHADVTTADTAVAASDMYAILQAIEYKNIVQAGFSQSGTRYLTASFWVKSTKTGTFCCFIKSADHARAYVKEYTVSATDTWEHKTLTFPVDTSGGASWNHNDVGATLGWALYGGTNYQITADVWTTTSSNYAPCTVNQVNALDSASNNFKITGVQLEVGSVATPFEHRSYGEELALCQRYYEKSYDPETAPGSSTATGMVRTSISAISDGSSKTYIPFKVAKRAAPAMTAYRDGGATGNWYYLRNGQSTESAVTFAHTGTQGTNAGPNLGSAWATANTYGHWTADAEL